MPFFLSLLAAKGLGALVGGLLLLIQGAPGFAAPVLVVARDTVYISTRLEHGFNKSLDQLLLSGSTVAIGYTATLLFRDREGRIIEAEPKTFVHSAVYDPAARQFAVYRSEITGNADSLVFVETPRAAKELLTRVRAGLALRKSLFRDGRFACRIEAALNTIKLEALDSQELDLNVFWNFRYPRAVTAWSTLEGR